MRLSLCLLLGLVLLNDRAAAQEQQTRERHYYIAAVEIDWNYYGSNAHGSGLTHKKVVFREYEKGFKQAKTHPSWLGLVGPTLRAEEGETIVVTFRNMATRPYSIHPHGIAYGKQSEGAHYFDNTSQKEKEDDTVRPGREHVYYWEVTSEIAPQWSDPSCLTYSYISHDNFVEDYNSGLIGTLLVCKPGSLDQSGQQTGIHREYTFLFGVFDEKESKYKPASSGNHVKYTINGFTMGSLPDVSMCANAPVSLHLHGMSSEPEVFSIHINGQVLQHTGRKVSSVGLISGASTTASMRALHAGRWMISSHITKHMEAGMHGFLDVTSCANFKPPRRTLTIQQRKHSREWKYYIAAEEMVWDYAPEVHKHVDEDFKAQYLRQSPTRIGKKYKKVVYSLYKNESFTERLETKQRRNELGILGPVIRAQVRDVVTIVFKNLASRPYSIYPHGLSIKKSEEGANYPAGGNQSHGVQPGETHTYVWNVLEEDEPLHKNPQCQTRVYHSAVDTPRDIASGLIGPILICRSQSLNVRNVQLKADKEQHAVLAVFDENKSWYLDDNIRQFSDRSQVNKADPEFYKSNVMHTINGYAYESGPLLGFCNGEIATWHVSSVGVQDYIQTPTFYGHPFELYERMEDFLSLYPMTGETITMKMDNIGVWLLASLNSHQTMKGLRVKFQDVECFRDFSYEYEDYDMSKAEFTVWNPLTLDEVLKKEEKAKAEIEKKPVEVDPYTDMYADLLDLRTMRNQSKDPSVELLDLSFLDDDAVDVEGGEDFVLKLAKPKGKDEASMTKPNITSSGLEKADGLIITEGSLVNQSSENTTSNSLLTLAKTENNTLKEELQGNSTEGVNVSLIGNQSSNNNISKDELTSRDVDNVFKLPTNSSIPGTPTSSTHRVKKAVHITANMDVSVSAGIIGHSLSDPEREGVDVHNLTLSEEKGNQTNSADSLISENEQKPGFKYNSTFTVDTQSNASLENQTQLNQTQHNQTQHNQTHQNQTQQNQTQHNQTLTESSSQEVSVNATGSNSSSDISLRNKGNATDLLDLSNQTSSSSSESLSNKTVIPGSSSVSMQDSSLEIIEEVVIYLKENDTNVIKTTSIKTQEYNWTYDGTHQVVPMEIPDDLIKYLDKDPPKTTTAPPKKTKKVTLRQWPQRGQGMKTKRRKEYKPQGRSGLPFSPRGFNPGMTPRGARPNKPQPVTDEENLFNMPVVIGVPRPDFSDYELYATGGEPDHLNIDDSEVQDNEYEYVVYKDPYSGSQDIQNLNLDETAKYYMKKAGPDVRMYFIAAVEVDWDYAGYGQRRQEATGRETEFKKVIFRRFMDSSFTTPEIRGEMDEHLGILGPVIKAEVGQSILVVFRNNASRPFSIHPTGISYVKQTEGLSYEDGSSHWFQHDNAVQPNTTFTYLWQVPPHVGPTAEESDCRTWAYHSGVNPERDINSGLIGPLLVCRNGTLERKTTVVRDFTLLFMTFDESQSWYYEQNSEKIMRKSRRRTLAPDLKENLKFHSINGIIYNLKGLRMYTNQTVAWHLINMGSPKDFQSVHFHGQTFLHKKTNSYRQAVFPLLPGGFATLEMVPSKPGLWQLDTEIGFIQQRGMQTLFLVIDNNCSRPLGLESSSVKDDHMTALSSRGYWKPHLARLNNNGQYNAWSTDQNNNWIQVDFQRPVVISEVATQGAKQMFYSQYVKEYYISYSTDRRQWSYYKGDSTAYRKLFSGNQNAYDLSKNTFFPPMIGRFVRLHPITWYSKATLRMEFYGCELDGCSLPLGIESGLIRDSQITASSAAYSWYAGSWSPSLARLNRQGTINAWQAKHNDMNQWLQVELPNVKKITGIVTQGARALGREMYVAKYSLLYSDNGIHWTPYTEEENVYSKTFSGNKDNNDHVKNYIHPPIFARYIRIVPKLWVGSITMRIELLGCDLD